jgi:hypothetical protein
MTESALPRLTDTPCDVTRAYDNALKPHILLNCFRLIAVDLGGLYENLCGMDASREKRGNHTLRMVRIVTGSIEITPLRCLVKEIATGDGGCSLSPLSR